ncbi:DUF3871 family protein [Flavobacterium sp. AJR]|uniref:DUF3871 family protein n=1 Tax=Flavobacterium sp. AJR TaxID=1979369 RepID=UPI000A3D811B|nr:DUF3871 family protein [Flavobacterium sp. AJR]OUL60985.1 hypothetical protein B8T70_17715 [Flavobacterium sp. AJR]
MNLILNDNVDQIIEESEIIINSKSNFIEANTIKVELEHLKNECTIPVFSKDNESTISHYEFIQSTLEVVHEILNYKNFLKPEIRTSHVIKGRIPSAIGKPVKDLLEHEKTIYYERMAFVIEVPEISESINGNKINLAIGGVRAYNQENLFSKKTIEKFKIFIGFQNSVCTNLCISTDGLKEDVRVSSIYELKSKIYELINSYNRQSHLVKLKSMADYSITEKQFAHLIGKMKMFGHLSKQEKQNIFPLNMNDNQISIIVKNYYEDSNFSKNNYSHINLWMLYNLFTEANKSSYIDQNLSRNVNAYEFINELSYSLKNNTPNWFLHLDK